MAGVDEVLFTVPPTFTTLLDGYSQGMINSKDHSKTKNEQTRIPLTKETQTKTVDFMHQYATPLFIAFLLLLILGYLFSQKDKRTVHEKQTHKSDKNKLNKQSNSEY